jgi:predicted transporter
MMPVTVCPASVFQAAFRTGMGRIMRAIGLFYVLAGILVYLLPHYRRLVPVELDLSEGQLGTIALGFGIAGVLSLLSSRT